MTVIKSQKHYRIFGKNRIKVEIISLLIELAFLIAGIYVYLFSIGRVRAKDPALSKKAESFRARNGGWLRILSLALIALMAVEIYLHITQLNF